VTRKRKKKQERSEQIRPSLAALTATNADLISITSQGFSSWIKIPYYLRKISFKKLER